MSSLHLVRCRHRCRGCNQSASPMVGLILWQWVRGLSSSLFFSFFLNLGWLDFFFFFLFFIWGGGISCWFLPSVACRCNWVGFVQRHQQRCALFPHTLAKRTTTFLATRLPTPPQSSDSQVVLRPDILARRNSIHTHYLGSQAPRLPLPLAAGWQGTKWIKRFPPVLRFHIAMDSVSN